MGFRQILGLFCLIILHSISLISANFETYIVHVESPDEFEHTELSSTTSSHEDLEKWYHSFLPTSTASSSVSDTEEPRIVHCYQNVFKGFAARLSPEHVKAMETKPGFVSARPEKVFSLHTTHSPNFLGLNQNSGLWKKTNFGKGMIIAVLDTGVVPEHPSFRDQGMPPPPAKWKGKCHFKASLCNKKLIGAVDLSQGNGIPIDENGHGTHTASTAAGNFVSGASVFGNANGTAAGVAPLAHLAIYKVCDSTGSCVEGDVVAGMDAAIGDGVDVISISIGGDSGPLHEVPSELSAFSAMRRGIFVSRSAGNSGPGNFTAVNVSPWILTVGASSINRKVRVIAVLGNKQQLQGESLYQPSSYRSRPYPLFFPNLNGPDPDLNSYCYDKLVKVKEAKGKIVICAVGGIDNVEKGKNVKAAGGVGMIVVNLHNMGFTTDASPHVIPATHLSSADGISLLSYLNSTSSPKASLSFKGTLIEDAHAPEVGYFSSRGPNNASRGILKPDILGPGVNILAAWHESVENKVNTKSNFNVISGTSMSCPHLSGVAALLKSAHPDWSPAAIKSAIMTTADIVNLAKNPIQDEKELPADLFATGSGHVNPVRADNPGLVYDIDPRDYIPYLCGLNYTDEEVRLIVQRKVKCTTRIPEAQLNYPSFAIEFGEKVQKYTRKVTNVGDPKSVYTVNVVPPPGVKVTVKPRKLGFSKLNQKLAYEVTFDLQEFPPNMSVLQGSISWMSEKHSVRSPIAATKKST